MPNYRYKNYIKKISDRFVAELAQIQSEYNFDLGDEFEIAVCKILRHILPEKYGVCRGFVVDHNSNTAGDDIIIYEQVRFPTFGLREKNEFARKEYIPIDAVYCYIEAKHTINIVGDDAQSFAKAREQVAQVKALCYQRPDVTSHQITPTFKLHNEVTGQVVFEELSPIRNPILSIIFARQVRDKKGGNILTDSLQIEKLLKGEHSSNIYPRYWNDLTLLGQDVAIVPQEKSENDIVIGSPFFLGTEQSGFKILQLDGIAVGYILVSMLFALDWIQLGSIPYLMILNDAVRNSPSVSGLVD